MCLLATLTAGLTLAVGALVVSKAELAYKYRLTDSYSNSCPTVPYTTFAAPSRVVCSAQCKKANYKCNGFQYLPDGTCQLFRVTGGGTPTVERPLIFLLGSSCPGTCACPAGFTRCAGRCLAHILTKYNYPAAEVVCAARGAHLFVPRSHAENQCALNYAQAHPYPWLGVTDIVTEGQWVGADAPCSTAPLPASSAWWYPNTEPTRLTDEDCINVAPTGWVDSICLYTSFPICQLANCHRPECP